MHRGTAQRRNSTQGRRMQQHGIRKHAQIQHNDTFITVLFACFSTLQQRWKHPNIQNTSSFLLLPPFSPSPVAVDGGPFSCSLEPPKYWQFGLAYHLPVGNHVPNPESVVSAVLDR
jgi:hypothetical protein